MKNLLRRSLCGGLVSLCVLLYSSAVYSQEQETSTETDISPKFGIKGGFNLTNMYVSDVKDENMKFGPNVGLFAKIPLVRGLSIQPELLYSSKGARLTYNNILGNGNGEYRFNLNYIETPISLVINLARNLNIHGGAYAAYLASANVKHINNDGDIDVLHTYNADNFHRFDYGLLGGIAVDVQNFTMGARYNYGLQQVGKSNTAQDNYTKNSKNSALTFYIGFAF